MRTRPVYHGTDAAIRGHIFCSFLALVLKQELEARMREAGIEAEWAGVVRDLRRLSETVVELQGKRFAVRTQAQGGVPRIVRYVGASLPNAVRRCDEPAGQLAGPGATEGSKRDPLTFISQWVSNPGNEVPRPISTVPKSLVLLILLKLENQTVEDESHTFCRFPTHATPIQTVESSA